ncbi:MAG: hypothetical protein APF77_07130 [Clostridia bacterium BRH_c25]|nr:MAG: hypothetical protein APF77_07130 [Clostridia bacterium BRH_c25]
MRLKGIFCYFLIFTMILTGCSGGGNNAPAASNESGANSDQTAETAVKDSVNFSINAEPSTLDPQKGNDLLTFAVHSQIFDTLVRENADGSLVPGLAEKWTISEDGKEIVFTLRNDVKFHNGDLMTADDVVYSLNRAITSTFTKRITGSMDKAEKIDDSTVKLVLKYSYGPILDCIATTNVGIVPQKAVEANEEGFARNPVGTGPFKFKEWNNGEKIVFESFKDYYRGEASIKNLTFKIISDKTSAAVALENGEVDVLLSPDEADRKNLIANEKLTYYETESNSFYFVSFNNETGLFSNKLLREAISYAVDRESLVMGALEGNGAPLESAIPTNTFGSPENFKGNQFDIEKAKALLAEAGYPNGLTIKVPTLYLKPTEVLQDQLRQIGIVAEIEQMERGAWLQDVYTDNKYEITVGSYSALVPDADQITYNRYHGDFVGGGNNMVRCNIPELNKELDLARTSQSVDERKAAYLRVSEILRDESVLIPLYSSMNGIAANKDLKGVQAHPVQRVYVYDYSWK